LSAVHEPGQCGLECGEISGGVEADFTINVLIERFSGREKIKVGKRMKKMNLVLCAVMVCTVLAGCSTKNAAQGERDTEQSTQNQTIAENQNEDAVADADKSDDGYPRGEQIAEQTFDLNLEPIGQVTFASYLPDDSENPLADVVFLIEKDGEILSQLPGVSEDNVNTEMFCQVEAVNFSDYNYDGCDDIILIISYYFGAGPQAATPHATIRYYTGSETGEFTYEKEMSQNATIALVEITIKTAKEFIGYNGPKQETTPVGDEVAKSLYEAFLKNEISVVNPYAEGTVLSVMDDEDYEFADAKKEYTFLDVNDDGSEELIFRMTEYYSNIMYILGISREELVVFDVYITHSKNMAHGVYDNGIVWWGQNYDGEEEVFYTYTSDGAPRELIHFVKENEMTDDENTYDYYYLDGNEEEKVYLQSYDEYESVVSAYEGEWLEWNDLSTFTGL